MHPDDPNPAPAPPVPAASTGAGGSGAGGSGDGGSGDGGSGDGGSGDGGSGDGGSGDGGSGVDAAAAAVDVATLAAVEIIGVYAADLMTAAAVKLGLFEGGEAHRDLAEARMLINALAGFVDGAAPEVGHHHAAPLRDGLATLQRAFREYSPIPDAPGAGPGERYTGPVV